MSHGITVPQEGSPRGPNIEAPRAWRWLLHTEFPPEDLPELVSELIDLVSLVSLCPVFEFLRSGVGLLHPAPLAPKASKRVNSVPSVRRMSASSAVVRAPDVNEPVVTTMPRTGVFARRTGPPAET